MHRHYTIHINFNFLCISVIIAFFISRYLLQLLLLVSRQFQVLTVFFLIHNFKKISFVSIFDGVFD